jgi:hypothetical protein
MPIPIYWLSGGGGEGMQKGGAGPVATTTRATTTKIACSFFLIRVKWSRPEGSQRDVVYLGWPIAPFTGEGDLRGLSQ